MSSGDVLNSARIAAIVNAPIISLSRAGRNDAGHRRGNRDSGHHVAVSSIDTGKKKAKGHHGDTQRNADDAIALSIDADLIDNSAHDGVGGGGEASARTAAGATDAALAAAALERAELCSSPRPHPAVEAQRIREYTSQRLVAFEAIKKSTPLLPVYDEEGSNVDLVDQYAWRASSRAISGSSGAYLATAGVSNSPTAMAAAGEAGATATGDAQRTGEEHAAPMHLLGDVTKGNLAALLARQDEGHVAPTRPSAAFQSPTRWKEPRPVPGVVYPPVGHYYPRYKSTFRRDSVGGVISPLHPAPPTPRGIVAAQAAAAATNKASATVLVKSSSGGNLVDDVPAPALNKVASDGGLSLTGTNAASMSSPNPGMMGTLAGSATGGGDGSGTPGQGAIAPNPHMYMFKSRIPRLPTYQAAQDDFIWPRGNDLQLGATSPSKLVDMKRQVGRDEAKVFQALQGQAPPCGYNPRNDKQFAWGTGAHTSDLSKGTPRPPPGGQPHTSRLHATNALLLPLDQDKINRARATRQPVFDMSKGSPRSYNARTGGELTRNIDVPPLDLPMLQYTNTRIASIAPPHDGPTNSGRKLGLDLQYEVSESLTQHTPRIARIHGGTTGHQDLFLKSEAAGCPIYDVKTGLSMVSHRLIRDVDFDKSPARKEERAAILDLDYADRRHSPLVEARVKGDPMIHAQVSRAERETVAGGRPIAPDAIYDLSKIARIQPRRDVGNHNFAKQVDRRHVFRGRGLAPVAVWEAQLKADGDIARKTLAAASKPHAAKPQPLTAR